MWDSRSSTEPICIHVRWCERAPRRFLSGGSTFTVLHVLFLKMSGVTTARITASWISCARRTRTVQMMSDLVSGAFKEFLLLFFIYLFIHALDLLLERLTFRWRVKCCVYRPFDSVFTVSVWTDCRNFWGKNFCVSYQHFPQHSLTLGCSTWYISGGCRSGRVAGRLLFVPICF